jgi:DNA-binding NtrC family response regulator
MDAPPCILLIDDEPGVLAAYSLVLEDDFAVVTALTGMEGLALLECTPVAGVLLDLRLPDVPGLEVLRQIQTRLAPPAVIVLTAVNDARLAMEAIHLGAVDYLVKPVDAQVLLTIMARACGVVPQVLALSDPVTLAALGWVGTSPALRQLAALVQQVADTDATVLIVGETGVGKELVARALHQLSPRRTGPWVALNCAAIAPSLTESEFLGHERGAFTGAERQHRGAFERAQGGTLVLDQVDSLSPLAQAALLRIIQERELYRVGGERPLRVDVRLVATTNQPLLPLVAAGTFRDDLFYRLQVVPLAVPPLRERLEDIPLLVTHFLRQYSTAYGRPVPRITAPGLAVLRRHPWPGNVRELEHLIERLVALSTHPVLDRDQVRRALAAGTEGRGRR